MSRKRVLGSTEVSEWTFLSWKISEPGELFKVKRGEYYTSPELEHGNNNWFLKLYPMGQKSEFENYISLFLCIDERKKHLAPVKVDFEITILDKHGEPFITKNCDENENLNSSSYFDLTENSGKLSDCRGWPKFCTIKELKNNFKNLVNEDGELEIRCLFKIKNKRFRAEDIIIDLDAEPVYTEPLVPSPRLSKLKDDNYTDEFEIFFNDRRRPNMKIKSKNKQFSAHKDILIKHSDVFKVYFGENKRERNLDMTQYDSEVVLEMLRFMYIGQVKNIVKNYYALKQLSEIYGINSLKKFSDKALDRALNSVEFNGNSNENITIEPDIPEPNSNENITIEPDIPEPLAEPEDNCLEEPPVESEANANITSEDNISEEPSKEPETNAMETDVFIEPVNICKTEPIDSFETEDTSLRLELEDSSLIVPKIEPEDTPIPENVNTSLIEAGSMTENVNDSTGPGTIFETVNSIEAGNFVFIKTEEIDI